MEIEFEMSEDDRRIMAIFSPDNKLLEPPPVVAETLAKYHEFLVKHLPNNLLMTGRETMGYFAWEEKFEFGFGTEGEYKKLLHTQASCVEKFELVELSSIDDELGSIAKVFRVRDKKIFYIPLADLEACKQSAAGWQIMEDYSMWVANY